MKGAAESLRFSGAGLYLGAALFLALLAAFAVYSFLHAAVPSEQVFVVTRDLPPGTKITDRDLATKAFPASSLPDGAVIQRDKILGQRIRFGLAAGDVIRTAHLAPTAISEIPQQIAAMGDAYRAVMIPAELVPGQTRLTAGDKLELLAVVQLQEAGKPTTRLLPLGMATVLDDAQTRGSGDKATILIAMKAEDVARYALAARTGTVVVTVPGQENAQFVPAIKLDDLAGTAPTTAAPTPATAAAPPKAAPTTAPATATTAPPPGR